MKLNKDKQEDMGKVAYLKIPFHRSKIRAITSCHQQKLVVTTSDSTLMLWSYSADHGQYCTMELMNVQQLDDLIQAVAFHPSGFNLVVSHFDRVKIFSLLSGGSVGGVSSKKISI